ncbi:MAG TPA: adenylate/guanylate cyclase domain-containing protein [Burkholderiales bacterium]|nr:adenylate/guanylate cyclase domain-containing protein [Burkholderiales bacterium]
MPEHTNRTFICSVLFLDIVEYSQRSVAEQIALKERFNAVLTEAITGVPTDDRIILDTGDGAAVSFLGDPEDTLFAGMSLRDSVATYDASTGPRLQIRVGVNLGPVRLVKDINGQPNIIGDGINVAQRVMSFAEPGQILVSRSYYDVMARLSEDFAKLFSYEGAKTDKHVREHEVYAISAAPSSLKRTVPVPAPRAPMRLPSLRLPRILKLGPQKWSEALAVNSKLLVAAPLAFTLIVGTGVIARSHRNDDEVRPASAAQAPRVALAPKAEAAPPKPAVVETPPPAQPAPHQAEEPKPAAKEQNAPHQAKDPAPKANAPAQTARASEAETAAPAPAPKSRDPEAVAIAPTRDGTINIIALPWAEVFIDGNRQGVSPPLKAIPLKPGKHRVELRNGSFPPHVQTVELRPGSEISVTHRFRR